MKKTFLLGIIALATPAVALAQVDTSMYNTRQNPPINALDTMSQIANIRSMQAQQQNMQAQRQLMEQENQLMQQKIIQQELLNKMQSAQVAAARYMMAHTDPRTGKINMQAALIAVSKDPEATPAIPWMLEQGRAYNENLANN